MKYFFLYALAFAAAFFTALLLAPFWRKLCLRVGLIDEPGGRKTHGEPVPLAGGLTVMTGILIPATIGQLLILIQEAGFNPATAGSGGAGQFSFRILPLDPHLFQLLAYGLHKRAYELAAIFLGALGMLTVGILDDKHELRPGAKFIGQFLVALLVAMTGARITLFVPSPIFSYVITILWILTVINAFNFMDNMNGLCGGLGAIGALCFTLVSALSGQYLVALIAALTCGALVGFLPYNFPRGRIFLGDSGSHVVGYLLAVLAILPHFHTPEQPRAWAVLYPLLILAVPLGDLAWVVFQRWRAGKPIYVGDTTHLSHRLVQAGLSRTHAVLWIWLLAAVVGALALL
jgi:UDP-GlcNAc:undecaprenyl-phosphate/decaprenyl-phosphate GlcNAc-1-phosphate transferase